MACTRKVVLDRLYRLLPSGTEFTASDAVGMLIDDGIREVPRAISMYKLLLRDKERFAVTDKKTPNGCNIYRRI